MEQDPIAFNIKPARYSDREALIIGDTLAREAVFASASRGRRSAVIVRRG